MWIDFSSQLDFWLLSRAIRVNYMSVPTGVQHRSLLVELLFVFLVKSMAELKNMYVRIEQILARRLFTFKFTVS